MTGAAAFAVDTGLTQGELVERVLEDEARLLLVDVRDPQGLLEALTLAARRSGRSVYLWSESDGLTSLRESGIAVPGTRSLVEALRYMQQTQHFGIYLFRDYQAQLHGAAVGQLRQLARARSEPVRRAILLGKPDSLPHALAGIGPCLSDAGRRKPRLRLRGGLWVT